MDRKIYYFASLSLMLLITAANIMVTNLSSPTQDSPQSKSLSRRNFMSFIASFKIKHPASKLTMIEEESHFYLQGLFLTEKEFLDCLKKAFQTHAVYSFSLQRLAPVTQKNLQKLSLKKLDHFFKGEIRFHRAM